METIEIQGNEGLALQTKLPTEGILQTTVISHDGWWGYHHCIILKGELHDLGHHIGDTRNSEDSCSPRVSPIVRAHDEVFAKAINGWKNLLNKIWN